MTGHDSYSDLPTIPDFPTSLEPHELLEIMVGELKNPIDSIEGWARVLAQDTNLEAISLEAAESIPAITAYVRALLERVDRYLEARAQLQKKEVTTEDTGGTEREKR
jgi:nitrogen-specific signal transduction histidine kinase